MTGRGSVSGPTTSAWWFRFDYGGSDTRRVTLTKKTSITVMPAPQLPTESTVLPKPFNLNDTVRDVTDHFRKRLAGEADLCGLSTGYPRLDTFTKGLKPGLVFVAAARPAMGKTTLMLNIAEHICIDQKVPVMIVSCASTAFEIVQRIVFSRAGFAPRRLDQGYRPTKDDHERIQQATMEMLSSKLFVDDAISSIEAIRAQAIQRKHDDNIGFLAIDHLQLLKSDSMQAGASRKRAIAEILSGIRSLARELGIPILVLAELNRGPERRRGKLAGVPRFSDIRSRRAVVKYADMIGLLYREAYYRESQEDNKGEPAWLNLIDLRQTDVLEIPLSFHPDTSRFEAI